MTEAKPTATPLARPSVDGRRDRSCIDNKLEALKEHIKTHSIEKPDFKLLSEFFTKGEISALWMRMSAARKNSPMDVQEAWDSLKNLKTGANKCKNDTLMSFLTLPGDAWQTRLLTFTETFKQSKKHEERAQEFTRGELHQIHGEEEV